MKFRFLSVSCFLSLVLAACGGGGGGGDEPVRPETRVLRGVVEDGPIAGAQVFLRNNRTREILQVCGSGRNQPCVSPSMTGRQGIFSIPIPTDLDLAGVEIAAMMGESAVDQGTGTVFRGMEMSAPAGMSPEQAIVVSPVTTLVAVRMAEGESLARAAAATRSWLDLPAGTDLGARPSRNSEILRRSLLLSRIATELQDKPGAFRSLAAGIPTGGSLIEGGSLQEAVLAAHVADASLRQRIAALYASISAGTATAPEEVFRREELICRFRLAIGEALSYSGEVPEGTVGVLVDKILAAAGETVIPLDIYHINALVKYLRHFYPLTIDDFYASPETFGEALSHSGQRLEDDPKISELLQLQYVHDIAARLEDEELLESEEQRRRYYFNANHSRFVRAEKLGWAVLDDASVGAILLEIVKKKAAYGFTRAEIGMFENVPFAEIPVDELCARIREELEARIYDREYRAHTFREVAASLVLFGFRPQAVESLREAESLFRSLIENKRLSAANLDNKDFRNLQNQAASYRHAGDRESAQAVLRYMEDLTRELTTVVTFGRAIIGTRDLADEMIAAGESEQALEILASMYGLATRTPPNEAAYAGRTYRFYQARVFYLLEVAKRYADLDQWQRVLEIGEEVRRLRANDGLEYLTAGETWVYLPTLVELLCRGGAVDEGLALADSAPETYLNYQGVQKSAAEYRKRALMQVVTYEALKGPPGDAREAVAAAISMAERLFPVAVERLEALTYLAQNQKASPCMAKALINAGRPEAAREALKAAEVIVKGINPITDKDRYTQQVQLGYVKVAELYRQAGYAAEATALLGLAEDAAGGIAAGAYRVAALVDIAVGYHGVGYPDESGPLLQDALSVADAAAEQALLPEDAVGVYEAVARGAIRAGETDVARDAARGMLDQTRLMANDTPARTRKKVDFFLKVSRFYVLAGVREDAREDAMRALADARDTADSLAIPAERWGKYINDIQVIDPVGGYDHIIGGHVYAGDFEGALRLAEGLPGSLRDKGLVWLAGYLCQQDDFPGTAVADVDTDGDGLPDFFHPLATAEERHASGLQLDPDSDGDGIEDTTDRRPLYVDGAGR